jgi:2-keto-3-deoxy-L-rhamnonate aldolase RhmA
VRRNPVKAACAAGAVRVGSFVNTNDPLVAQIMAQAGFDWLLVDMEHGPVPISALQAMVAALRGTAAEPFVRASWNASTPIQTALDCGVSGIMIPMINTRADAESAVRDTRFWPLGERSRGGVRHAVSFETDAATYYARANDEVLVMAQIETATAIANLEEIAAVVGIDCLFVGPNDLASTYDLAYPAAWELRSGAYRDAVVSVPAIARKHGKFAGILAASTAMANECFELGYTLVGVGNDATILGAAARRVRGELADGGLRGA